MRLYLLAHCGFDGLGECRLGREFVVCHRFIDAGARCQHFVDGVLRDHLIPAHLAPPAFIPDRKKATDLGHPEAAVTAQHGDGDRGKSRQ